MEFFGVSVNEQVPAAAAAKPKVVFVLGATATGKSKLAIALAEYFGGEVVNSDKIQVYEGFPVVTNKVTDEELARVRHHLIGDVSGVDDFTADEFRHAATWAIDSILRAGLLPVVAGGSNNYVKALVEGGGGDGGTAFRDTYDCLFLWLDAAPALLRWYTAVRVDDMVRRGLLDEAREAFYADADYTSGVRRAIGLPELHAYLAAEREGAAGEAELAGMLARAVREMKANTYRLALAQTGKIRRLSTLDGWNVRRIDATSVFARMAEGAGHSETWEAVVLQPAVEMVKAFLQAPPPPAPPAPAPAAPDAILPALEQQLALATLNEEDGAGEGDGRVRDAGGVAEAAEAEAAEVAA